VKGSEGSKVGRSGGEVTGREVTGGEVRGERTGTWGVTGLLGEGMSACNARDGSLVGSRVGSAGGEGSNPEGLFGRRI